MHVVKSVGVLSVAKVLGLLYACMGLLFAPLFLMMGMIGTMLGQDKTPFAGIFGIVFALFMPIFYGLIGFIGGALMAFLYNLFSRWVGGFELELVERTSSPTAPYPLIPPVTSAV